MADTLSITLPDGSVREVAAGTTPADIAASISPGLLKASIAARVNGELRDLGRAFDGDSALELVTAKNEADALELARHDFAHVLAEAVQALHPGTQITFGPSTEDGFYYDFAPAAGHQFTDADLPAIEAKMREIIAADKPLRREIWNRDDLIATGGTMMAGRRLLEKLGAEVTEGAAIVDLPELGGSAKLRDSGLALFTLLDFDGH